MTDQKEHELGVSLKKVNPSSIVEVVYQELESALLSGKFKLGERLNEVRLSKQMGVSRGPFREAARQLERRGWLKSEPRRGFFVRTFSPNEIANIFDYRLCLETYAVRQAVGTLTDAQLRNLKMKLHALEIAANEYKTQRVAEATMAFHQEICALSENQVIIDAITDISLDIQLFMALLGTVYSDPLEFVRRNQRIIDAIEARDVETTIREIEDYTHLGRDEVIGFFDKPKT